MSLTLPSQLLLQQALPSTNTLLINPPQDDLSHELPKSIAVASFSWASMQQYEKQGFPTHNILELPTTTFEQIVIFLPKAKTRLQYVLDYAQNCLKEDGEIWFVGENKGGIKSLAKVLKTRFKQAEKITSGKHSAIVSAKWPEEKSAFLINRYFQTQHNQLDIQVSALPGVFSQEKLDNGTALLLKHIPRKLKGRVLDFGCGAGIIGSYLCKHFDVENVDMIDDDLPAVLSAQRTLKENGIENAEAFLSNGFSEIEERYNWIVSNPPFHQGVKTHYQVTETFLAEAKNYLKLSGRLMIVANDFLSYETILREHFKTVTEVVKENGFKVLMAEGIMRK